MGNGRLKYEKITPKWWFWLIFIKFWWIQIRISQQLQWIRTIVDQFHDPCVILYRSGSSVYYKIWQLLIWIFDRYCIFEFEFWPLEISNFKKNLIKNILIYILHIPKILCSNYQFWLSNIILNTTSSTGVFNWHPSRLSAVNISNPDLL